MAAISLPGTFVAFGTLALAAAIVLARGARRPIG
jgi:hypothetical protein